MPAENILVIAVDGLRAAALGAYGNTSYSTPALDQFAAESLLFDWCYADAVELTAICRKLWRDCTALADRGYATTLLTDEPAILQAEGAASFQESIALPASAATRATDVAETQLASLFATVGNQIARTSERPRLLWVHSRGMYGAWDAPLELQEDLLAREEGDPPPEDVLAPPDLWLNETSDPDAAFRWSCAYAAQVMALDACLEGVCQTIADVGPEKWLVVLLGLRGFPLGEHGKIGGVDGRLYAEQLHVPMLCRFPDGREQLSRNATLVSIDDFGLTRLAGSAGAVASSENDALIASGPRGEAAIRTTHWSLVTAPNVETGRFDDGCRRELFVRPDDRWEANDVASLCPEVVEALLARLAAVHAL